MSKVPERIAWALDRLEVQPDDQILEFGFGPGVSVERVCEQLDAGRITAIDRSATAVDRAQERLAEQVAAGHVRLEQVDLAGFRGEPAQFDKALGVNVNVFWTGSADPEIAVLARVLRPGGVVHLVYEGPPGGAVRGDIGPQATTNLQRHGFTTELVAGPAPNLLCVSGSLRN